MEPYRFLTIIVAGEGTMLGAAVAGAAWARVPLATGSVPAGILWGLVAAGTLGWVNLALLRWQSNRWPGNALRYICGTIVRPLFAQARVWQILLVSALAGAAEELLFRGLLQPLVGLAAASVIFGAVHVGGRAFIGYGAWAACIGAFFGWLMIATGGLVAPVVAHAVYDALALAYVRFGPADICEH